jgi:hypothetical protein
MTPSKQLDPGLIGFDPILFALGLQQQAIAAADIHGDGHTVYWVSTGQIDDIFRKHADQRVDAGLYHVFIQPAIFLFRILVYT